MRIDSDACIFAYLYTLFVMYVLSSHISLKNLINKVTREYTSYITTEHTDNQHRELFTCVSLTQQASQHGHYHGTTSDQ